MTLGCGLCWFRFKMWVHNIVWVSSVERGTWSRIGIHDLNVFFSCRTSFKHISSSECKDDIPSLLARWFTCPRCQPICPQRWRKTEATEPNQAASLNISGVVGVLVMEKYVNESWVYGSTKKNGYIGCFRRLWHPYQHIGTTMNKILWGCLWTKQHFKIHVTCFAQLGSFQSQLAFHPTKPRS